MRSGRGFDTWSMNRRIRTAIKTNFAAGRLRGEGKIKNVAEGGLFVGTSQLPDEGESVVVSFRAPGGTVDVEGLVWWTTNDEPGRHRTPGFGLRLLEESADFSRFFDSLN